MEDVETKKRNPFLSSSSVLELLSAASSLLHQSQSATSPIDALRLLLLHLLRLVVVIILSPLVFLLSRRHRGPHHKKSSSSFSYSSPAVGPTPPAERALSHVLSVVSQVPVSSRKYELVKSLADRLLDDNLRFSSLSLNSAALSSAFSRTLRRLERASPPTLADRSADLLAAAVRSGLRRLSILEEEEEGCSAEKMAAEALWLAKRMAECGAAEEAVAKWGEAAGIARMALSAEPRLQAAFVRVSAFLFKQANKKQFGRKEDDDDDCSKECGAQLAMLTSWLPLLCRATNGTDAPTLSSAERAEMVKVLEEMIEKLSWDQQEVVLALWLHHFTSCPDSDWPNLESCYTRWYSESRNLLLK